MNAKTYQRPERVTTIFSSGLVKTRTRIISKVACPMDLRYDMKYSYKHIIFKICFKEIFQWIAKDAQLFCKAQP